MAGEEELAGINLVPGQSGGGLMTTIGQKALDGAYLGSVPAELQIGLGNPSSIIQSINSGGTGLVVSPRAPCDDWNTFIGWAEARSLQGRPLVIATVQSSIQEEMIRSALAYENITVKLYGSPV
jgi:ABC-type nitrate/sulfonate/bicarbonate transport system substrate-binding protein